MREHLDVINMSKSPGTNEIHPKLMFELGLHLVQVSTKNLNISWNDNRLPEDWNWAHLVSICKKD